MDDATGFAVNHRYSKHGRLQICCTSSISVIKLQLKSKLSKEYNFEKPRRVSILFWDKSILTMLPIFACQFSHMLNLFMDRLSSRSSWRQVMSHSSSSLLDERFKCCSFGTNLIAQSTLVMLLLTKLIEDSFFHVCK